MRQRFAAAAAMTVAGIMFMIAGAAQAFATPNYGVADIQSLSGACVKQASDQVTLSVKTTLTSGEETELTDTFNGTKKVLSGTYSPAPDFDGQQTVSRAFISGVGVHTINVVSTNDPGKTSYSPMNYEVKLCNPPAQPAQPTVTASATTASYGEADATITVTVTNTADKTKASTTYSVAIGKATKSTGSVADGKSGSASLSGYAAGNYTVKVTGADGTSASTSVKVSEKPKPVDHTPKAGNDSATTEQDTPVTVNVLANDDANGSGQVTIASVSKPAHGTAVIKSGKVVYTPKKGYHGSDSFTYTVKNSAGESDTATVTVTVTKKETPPPPTTQTVHVKSSTLTQGCEANEVTCGAHFVITQIGDKAPQSISVTLSTGKTVTVDRDKITGKTAHYTVEFNAGVKVTDATATVPSSWSGQFNLSHYLCKDKPTTPPTTCVVGTPNAVQGDTSVSVTGAKPGDWLVLYDATNHANQTRLTKVRVGNDCGASLDLPKAQCQSADYQWDLTSTEPPAKISDTNGDGIADVPGFEQGEIFTVQGDQSECSSPSSPPPSCTIHQVSLDGVTETEQGGLDFSKLDAEHVKLSINGKAIDLVKVQTEDHGVWYPYDGEKTSFDVTVKVHVVGEAPLCGEDSASFHLVLGPEYPPSSTPPSSPSPTQSTTPSKAPSSERPSHSSSAHPSSKASSHHTSQSTKHKSSRTAMPHADTGVDGQHPTNPGLPRMVLGMMLVAGGVLLWRRPQLLKRGARE